MIASLGGYALIEPLLKACYYVRFIFTYIMNYFDIYMICMKNEIHHIVICTNLVRLYHERLFELCMKVRLSAISLLNRRTSVTLGFRNLRNKS